MKTNQVMKRNLGALAVLQRTKDAYFNATELVNGYNALMKEKATAQSIYVDAAEVKAMNTPEAVELQASENQQILIPLKTRELEVIDNQHVLHTPKKGYVKMIDNQCITERPNYEEKRLDRFMRTDQTCAFIESIARNEGLAVSDVVKTSRARADRGGGTWVHPLLFIDLCMWLDADFKYQALKFVQDAMIHYRNMAGEAYKELSAAVASITPAADMPKVMATVAKGINYIMWNNHDDGERNSHATEKDMHALFAYERHIAALVSDEFITTPAGLLQFLRKQWNKKWNPIKELA